MTSMTRLTRAAVALAIVLGGAVKTQQPGQQPDPAPTRPPARNDQTLRKLSPDEIPPNLSFYAVDPLYRLASASCRKSGGGRTSARRSSTRDRAAQHRGR